VDELDKIAEGDVAPASGAGADAPGACEEMSTGSDATGDGSAGVSETAAPHSGEREVAAPTPAEPGRAELDAVEPTDAEVQPEPGLSAPAPENAALEGLATAVSSLDERLGEAQRLLTHQTELAAKLHADNQRLRTGELRAALLPLVRDLLRLHDDIGRIAEDTERAGDLELIRISLLDALARNGIVPLSPVAGEPFDPKRHSATSVLQTDVAERDRSIAGVVRTGFEWDDGHTIRVADVSVYRCAPPDASGVTDASGVPDASGAPEGGGGAGEAGA
jgi:molecular chaperone GrpE (heat shock protein)